jgi:hypothetical protein
MFHHYVLELFQDINRRKWYIKVGGHLYITKGHWGGEGGSENGDFLVLYVLKMSLRRGVGGSKKAIP